MEHRTDLWGLKEVAAMASASEVWKSKEIFFPAKIEVLNDGNCKISMDNYEFWSEEP